MSDIPKFGVRERLVPPVLLPIFFGLLSRLRCLLGGSCPRLVRAVSSSQWGESGLELPIPRGRLGRSVSSVAPCHVCAFCHSLFLNCVRRDKAIYRR